MITTVAFDADDTLVDIRTAVNAGLSAVTAAVADPALTLELFAADAEDHWTLLADRPARDIRAAAMRHTLARAAASTSWTAGWSCSSRSGTPTRARSTGWRRCWTS
ncbi:hypothetical protein ACFQZ4_22940 [Catellatospora coxensis]